MGLFSDSESRSNEADLMGMTQTLYNGSKLFAKEKLVLFCHITSLTFFASFFLFSLPTFWVA